MTAETDQEQARIRSGQVFRLAALVFLLSLAIRIAWTAFSRVTPISDFQGYDQLAVDWLSTGRFAEPGSLAYRTPGYPGFLAVIYAIAGHSWKVAGFVQAFLGALTSGLLVVLASRILSPRASVIAGLLHSVSPTAIAYTPVLAAETLAAFLLVLSLVYVSAYETETGPRKLKAIAASGALFGLLVLVRPAAIFFLPAFIFLSVYQTKQRLVRVNHGVVLCLIAGLVLAPWMIRNSRAGLRPFTISTAGGLNFWMGNNDHSRLGGFCQAAVWDQEMSERDLDSAYRKAALSWIISHPGRYLALNAIRLRRLFGTEPDSWAAKYLWPTKASDEAFVTTARYEPIGMDNAPQALVRRAFRVESRNGRLLQKIRMVTAPLILLSLVAALLWWRDYAIVVAPALCYLGGIGLTCTEIRYREIADPLLFVPLAGLIAFFVFRSTELAREPLRPSQVLAAARAIVKAFTPDFKQQDATPTGLARASAEQTLADRVKEVSDYDFSPVSFTNPETDIATLWRYPTWRVTAARHADGLRCDVLASSDLQAQQAGGIVFRASEEEGYFRALKALRLEVSFLNPKRIQTVNLEARGSTGSRLLRWRWQVSEDALPPKRKGTYVLVPGEPSWYFLPEGEPDLPAVEEIRLFLTVAPNYTAGFVLHNLEIAYFRPRAAHPRATARHPRPRFRGRERG